MMAPRSVYPENGECDMGDHGACGHFGWCDRCPERPWLAWKYMTDVGVLFTVDARPDNNDNNEGGQ